MEFVWIKQKILSDLRSCLGLQFGEVFSYVWYFVQRMFWLLSISFLMSFHDTRSVLIKNLKHKMSMVASREAGLIMPPVPSKDRERTPWKHGINSSLL